MIDYLIRNFINSPEISTGQRHLISFTLYHLAPTIFCNKPSTLINFTRNQGNLKERWDNCKTFLSNLFLCPDLKLRFYEIKKQEERTLVLFFNQELLTETIIQPKNNHFLNSFGYKPGLSNNSFLETLKNRFAKGCPLEVGIFLGIPWEDVKGFIENKGKNYLFNKYWKVYQQPELAKRMYESYYMAKLNIFKTEINTTTF